MPALRAASPAACFLPARRPMIALLAIPAVTRMAQSGALTQGASSRTPAASVSMKYSAR